MIISTGVDIHTKETSFTEDMPSEYRNPRVIHQHNQDQQISIPLLHPTTTMTTQHLLSPRIRHIAAYFPVLLTLFRNLKVTFNCEVVFFLWSQS